MLAPGLGIFQDLGNGNGLHGFVGQKFRADLRGNHEAVTEYGMAMHCAVPGLEEPNTWGVYVFVQALGRYGYNSDRDGREWNGRRPRMKPGDSMWFITVDKATKKLIRDVPMELYRAGAGRIADGVPNRSGGMSFPYPDPGRYMVTTTYRRPDPQQPEHWLVDTSTLTFEIK